VTTRLVVTHLCLLSCCALLGCGQASQLDRVEVRGKVTFAGKPIQNGEIRFFPTQKTKGPVSGAPIVDGRYDVTQRGGVPVGNHRVEIEAFRPSRVRPELNAEGGHREQYLPEQFNIGSKLTAVVTADTSPMEINFDLPEK
jgi:hypothetical protein